MHFIIYRDKSRQWRWSLRAANGKIIADSAEAYKRMRDCQKGLALVQKSATARILVA